MLTPEEKKVNRLQSDKKYRENNKERAKYSREKSATKSFIATADLEDIAELEVLLKSKRDELEQLPTIDNIDLIIAKKLILDKKVTLYNIETNKELRKIIVDDIFNSIKFKSVKAAETMLGKFLKSKLNKSGEEIKESGT